MVSGHLNQKKGYYYIVLELKDAKGKRRPKWIATHLPVKGNKKRAETLLQQTRKEYEQQLKEDSNRKSEDGKILFSDYMKYWLEELHRPNISVATLSSYQANMKVIVPYFKNKGIYLQDLTAADINTFYSVQLKRVKGNTVLKYHANISKAIKDAVQLDYIPCSIMDKVRRPKKTPFMGKFLRQSEASALLDQVRGHKLEIGVIFGLFYGLRKGEVLGLKWDAFDFETNTFTIQHTVLKATIDGKVKTIEQDTTKTKSSFRTLPLIPLFRERMLEIKAEQERNRKLCGSRYSKKYLDYVYVDASGNRVKLNYLSEEFPKYMEDNGFRRMRFHDLRHSCASLMLASGISLKQIQEWLGHSDFAITANTYAHLDFNSKLASAYAVNWINNTEMKKDSDSQENKPANLQVHKSADPDLLAEG